MLKWLNDLYVLVQRKVFINMYITCIYLHISGVLDPGESFSHPPALYDMCPKGNSRLHFRNIDCTLTMSFHLPCFSRFLLPTSLQAHQHLRKSLVCFYQFLTDSPPVKCMNSSFMFIAAQDSRVGGKGASRTPSGQWSTFLCGDKLGAWHRMMFWQKGILM